MAYDPTIDYIIPVFNQWPLIIHQASTTAAGVMSAADKIKLDSLTPGGGFPLLAPDGSPIPYSFASDQLTGMALVGGELQLILTSQPVRLTPGDTYPNVLAGVLTSFGTTGGKVSAAEGAGGTDDVTLHSSAAPGSGQVTWHNGGAADTVLQRSGSNALRLYNGTATDGNLQLGKVFHAAGTDLLPSIAFTIATTSGLFLLGGTDPCVTNQALLVSRFGNSAGTPFVSVFNPSGVTALQLTGAAAGAGSVGFLTAAGAIDARFTRTGVNTVRLDNGGTTDATLLLSTIDRSAAGTLSIGTTTATSGTIGKSATTALIQWSVSHASRAELLSTTGTARVAADDTIGCSFLYGSGQLIVDPSLTYDFGGTTYLKINSTTTARLDAATILSLGDATATSVVVGRSGQSIGLYGAAGVTKYNTTGTLAGFTANASANAVFNESTFTGNTGATAYTISDIVRGLKLLNAITP